MTLYDELKTVASGLLNDPDFKQGTMKLIQRTPGAGPADNPGPATETTYNLSGVAKGVSFKYLMNNFAVQGDKEVTVAVVDGVTPAKNDFIEINGSRWKIVADISPVPDGTRVVWKFIVRKG